jgi:hypothetical protein
LLLGFSFLIEEYLEIQILICLLEITFTSILLSFLKSHYN